jgi:hypothetical protein
MMGLYFRVRNGKLSVQLSALLVVLLCVYAVVAPIASWLHGGLGVAAAAISAGLCLTGAGVALTAAHAMRSPEWVLRGMLIGIIARMIIPLGFGVGLHFYSQPLAEAGLLVYLLVFYPVTLGVETALALPGGNPPKSRSPAP